MLTDMAKDVVSRYEVDGFHWDYVRYPDRDSGYNAVALKRFKTETGATEDPAPEDPRFCDWRRRQIADFLKDSTAVLAKINSKLIVSASVFSNYKDSRDYRMADWADWCNSGILHACVPMDFSPDNKLVFNPRADFAATLQGKAIIWIGQGAYMNTPENTVKQLAYCRSKGFPGTVLYSYRNFSSDSTPTSRKEHANEMFKGRKTITIDNTKASVNGPWKTGAFGKMQGDDYLFIEGGSGSNSVVFKANLPESGEYDVFEWHVEGKNRSISAPLRIESGNDIANLTVNQQANGSKWNWLGRFKWSSGDVAVSIRDLIQDPKKVIVADAIRFVLVGKDASTIEPEVDATYLRRMQVETFSHLKKYYQPDSVSTPSR